MHVRDDPVSPVPPAVVVALAQPGGAVAVRRELAPCGTPAAYNRHRYHGEQPCEACRAAWSERCKEDGKANRKPWRRLGREPWVPTPREAAVLAAHRGGDLVLGGGTR